MAIQMMMGDGLDLDEDCVSLLIGRTPDRSRAFRLLRELSLDGASAEDRACALREELGRPRTYRGFVVEPPRSDNWQETVRGGDRSCRMLSASRPIQLSH